MKNLKTILLMAAMMCAAGAMAEKKAALLGYVHDRITHENLLNTRVTLMKGDSIVGVMETNKNVSFGSKGGLWIFMDVPIRGSEQYVLLFERDGYNVLSWPLAAVLEKKPLKNGEQRFLGDLPMDKTPRTHELDGVTIKATKVKFYTRGDTLVYDADAFQTAEGSMLDALIKQLPGAELTEEGEIFVNGRKVESLMLNGDDFFKGNNQIMLENLPAYMVKTVKTYEKRGPASIIAGRDMGDKEFVMDVGLKREYQIGWIGNVEGGLGTQDRYLARLFALRFTPKSRIALYGNLNNLNDTRKPGENSQWTPETMPAGLLATKKAGVDVLLKSRDEMSKYEGNAELVSTDLDERTETNGETFLQSGNTFQRSRTTARNRDFKFETWHQADLWNKKSTAMLQIIPRLTYHKTNSLVQGMSTTFNTNPNIEATQAIIDSVYQGSVINRNINNLKTDGHKLDMTLAVGGYTRLGPLYSLEVGQRISYADDVADNWRQQQIDYPNTPSADGMVSNRYNSSRPNNTVKYHSEVQLARDLSSTLCVALYHNFDYSRQHKDYATFQLEHLAGWDDINAHQIGALPSEIEYAAALDHQNSYDQHLNSAKNVAGLHFQYHKLASQSADSTRRHKHFYYKGVDLYLPVAFHRDRLDYARAAYDGITRRHYAFFNPRVHFQLVPDISRCAIFGGYEIDHFAPSMVYALNMRTDEDPLNIYYGNAHLHNTITHNAFVNYQWHNEAVGLDYNLTANYEIAHNSVAMGYIYDKTTGIRTYTPANVSGNYTFSLKYDYSRPLDKQKRLTLDNKLLYKMQHGVDLVGTDEDAPRNRSVMTYWTTEQMRLDYKISKKVKVGAKGYVGYGRSTSHEEDFAAVSLWDFHYGLTSLATLPLDLQLSTDLTMYCHRGYANAGSNTNDLVWNARLSKTFARSGITLAVDAFDILGNLSNISQVLNSQGRTETYRNSLPRYVMAHFIYRLNKKPKQR